MNNGDLIASFQDLLTLFKKESYFFCQITDISEAKDKSIVKAKMVDSPTVIINNIFLKTIQIEGGILVIPKIDSFVIVKEIGNERAYIELYSEIEEILINCEKITFNDGNFKGLVKVESMLEKINALENKINDLQTILTSHVHPETGATTSPSPQLASLSPITPISNLSDFENEKIKH